MKKPVIYALLVISIAVLIKTGCRQVPLTGRKQLRFYSEAQEKQMGLSAYQEILKNEKLSSNQRYVDMVRRVGHRIAEASGKTDFDWEFNVIASEQQNAFCLPGGKVAVYEGIIPICSNEAGLAVVMSHEIAHAIAGHGAERMSHEQTRGALGSILKYGTSGNELEKHQELIMRGYAGISQYGAILPFSRAHESEADQMGLIYMSKAGYDPEEAPAFWERFSQSSGGQKPIEWLSTHPSDTRRSRELRAQLPEALQLYANAPTRYGKGEDISIAVTGGP